MRDLGCALLLILGALGRVGRGCMVQGVGQCRGLNLSLWGLV